MWTASQYYLNQIFGNILEIVAQLQLQGLQCIFWSVYFEMYILKYIFWSVYFEVYILKYIFSSSFIYFKVYMFLIYPPERPVQSAPWSNSLRPAWGWSRLRASKNEREKTPTKMKFTFTNSSLVMKFTLTNIYLDKFFSGDETVFVPVKKLKFSAHNFIF